MAEKTPVDLTAFGDIIGAAIAQGIAATAPPKIIKEGDPEYTARLVAEGFYDMFDGVSVVQNGYEAQARGLSAQTRQRASHLAPGRYINGRVRIEVAGNGNVYINYPTKSEDDRNKNRDNWSSFSDLIDKIWAEMEAKSLVPA